MESPPVYKDDERDLGEKYEDFAGDFGRDAGKEATLVAYAQNYAYAPKIKDKGIVDYNALAELYRDYVLRKDVSPTKRKKDVEDKLNRLRAGERRDTKPLERSKEISTRKQLERKIEDLTILQQILDKLPG